MFSATLGSLNFYLITRADVEDAMMVGFWSAGSINRVTWNSLVPVLILAAVVVALVALLAPALKQMELGDDAATTQGVKVERTRLLLMVVGVATTALVTAAAGPISFIALVDPQLRPTHRRDARCDGPRRRRRRCGPADLRPLPVPGDLPLLPVDPGRPAHRERGWHLHDLAADPRGAQAVRDAEMSDMSDAEMKETMTDARLQVRNATIGYDQRIISTDLTVDIPHESFTAIIGPNGCGKSTLLRAVARVLTPVKGEVLLDGKPIASHGAKQVARQLGLLPQTSLAPEGIRVADLVARGRAPYQSLFHQWSPEDEKAVQDALVATRTDNLSSRLVAELSGGQRQRVWVAMLLAQQTPIMLLDEPTRPSSTSRTSTSSWRTAEDLP